jgi:hypothetical protein
MAEEWLNRSEVLVLDPSEDSPLPRYSRRAVHLASRIGNRNRCARSPNSAVAFGRVARTFTQGAALGGPFLVASSGLNRREVSPEAEWRRHAISRLACWFV